MLERSAALIGFVAVASASVVACGGTRPRDVPGDRRGRPSVANDAGVMTVPAAPPSAAPAPLKHDRPRVVVNANARAIAIDGGRLYYGDSDDSGVYSIPVSGGNPLRIARHAPVAGALAIEGGFITWIASPGDVVLRASVAGDNEPITLREHGIFSDVASAGGDIFVAEAIGTGGALMLVSSAASSRLATFDGPPRALMADGTHAFVVTSTTVLRVPRARGPIQTIASGARFTYATSDADFVYVVGEIDRHRTVIRVPKGGGRTETIASDVRDAPLEVDRGEVFFFDEGKPQLRSVRASGGPSRVVAEDPGFATVSAIAADAANVYVAHGVHASGAIVAIPR